MNDKGSEASRHCLTLVLLGGLLGLTDVSYAAEAALAVSHTDCAPVLQAFDRRVEEAGVGWSQATRVPGFTHLRVNRFLASFGNQSLNSAARKVWLGQMRALDRRGRELELQRLGGEPSAQSGLAERMEYCANQNVRADLGSDARFRWLLRAIHVPDSYQYGARIFGVYPLTFIPVAVGVQRLQHKIKTRFATEHEPATGDATLVRYQPPTTALEWAPTYPFDQNALGIPEIDVDTLNALFDRHAPIWEIETRGRSDKPGIPYWRTHGLPDVDPSVPAAYRFSSWTRWEAEILLQLNYLVWFSERPRADGIDLLGGHLDGLLWRVTLAPDGSILAYDSVHPCGCYHMLLPRQELQLRPEMKSTAEPPLVPAKAPRWQPNTRMVLRVESATHYLIGAYRDRAAGGTLYQFRDYDDLYRIVDPDGSVRGLFGSDGLVAGTERDERWVLWPMGVASPGAMRDRGHHAVAFVGRRHFDDPHLLEQMFQYR